MVGYILAWPRLARVLLVIATVLLWVMALFPLVDTVYVSYFFTPETIILPSLAMATLGLFVYVWGWLAVVGMVGERPEPALSARLFIATGLLLLLINMGLILQGLAMTNEIAG